MTLYTFTRPPTYNPYSVYSSVCFGIGGLRLCTFTTSFKPVMKLTSTNKLRIENYSIVSAK